MDGVGGIVIIWTWEFCELNWVDRQLFWYGRESWHHGHIRVRLSNRTGNTALDRLKLKYPIYFAIPLFSMYNLFCVRLLGPPERHGFCTFPSGLK